jgi:hypothetical protein
MVARPEDEGKAAEDDTEDEDAAGHQKWITMILQFRPASAGMHAWGLVVAAFCADIER